MSRSICLRALLLCESSDIRHSIPCRYRNWHRAHTEATCVWHLVAVHQRRKLIDDWLKCTEIGLRSNGLSTSASSTVRAIHDFMIDKRIQGPHVDAECKMCGRISTVHGWREDGRYDIRYDLAYCCRCRSYYCMVFRSKWIVSNRIWIITHIASRRPTLDTIYLITWNQIETRVSVYLEMVWLNRVDKYAIYIGKSVCAVRLSQDRALERTYSGIMCVRSAIERCMQMNRMHECVQTLNIRSFVVCRLNANHAQFAAIEMLNLRQMFYANLSSD